MPSTKDIPQHMFRRIMKVLIQTEHNIKIEKEILSLKYLKSYCKIHILQSQVVCKSSFILNIICKPFNKICQKIILYARVSQDSICYLNLYARILLNYTHRPLVTILCSTCTYYNKSVETKRKKSNY